MSYLVHRVNTDLFGAFNIVQSVGVVAGKSLIIDTLRDVFREDAEFKYVEDVFGFPKVRGQSDLDAVAGLEDDETTRIFIGSTYRQDIKYYPALSVKNTRTSYTPVSFNQDWMGVVYRKELLADGYGNNVTISTPAYNTLVGAWDQTFEVKVTAESELDREELVDIVSTILIGPKRLELQDAGLFIKTLSTGGEQEEPYGNGYLYTSSITLETRSEWKVHIPIANVMERIGLIVTFGNLETGRTADALTINQVVSITGQI
jgi:hypothetical protein